MNMELKLHIWNFIGCIPYWFFENSGEYEQGKAEWNSLFYKR